MLDAMAVTMVTYPTVFAELAGWPEPTGRPATRTPSIEPTEDGWIVVTTNSATQFTDFLVMIERPDLLRSDLALRLHPNECCAARVPRLRARVDHGAHQRRGARASRAVPHPGRTGAERLDRARVRALRGPRRVLARTRRPVRAPSAAVPDRASEDAPNLLPTVAGEDSGPRPLAVEVPRAGGTSTLPLDGIRVLDCTAWWAGPVSPHLMGALGADVIKVEATTRPDLMRYASVRPPSEDRWWEWGPVFHGVNTNKRGLTLDLTTDVGRELFERLVRTVDVLVENFTPRVMDQFGLTWERLREINPRLVMVRMPAFGLDGPWRDRTGFAQTMESLTGLAWLTGLPDGPPTLVRGACDPVSGAHATIATLLALEERTRHDRRRSLHRGDDGGGRAQRRRGGGHRVRATGQLLTRDGNRGVDHAPQGVYRALGDDAWVALAVTDDDQWATLCSVLGDASLAGDAGLATVEGRRAAHDRIDEAIAAWSAELERDDATDRLQSAGIPAEAVIRGRDITHNPQLRHRGLFEQQQHPVAGPIEVPMMPFRLSGVEHWLRLAAPTLGQHNAEILREIGVDDEELGQLEADGIVGTRPRGS